MPTLTPEPDGTFGIIGLSPVIGTAKAKTKFNANTPGKKGYEPPSSFRSFRGLRRIGLDTETVDPNIEKSGPGMHRKDGKIVGVGIGYGSHDATYYPVRHVNNSLCVAPNFYNWLREEAAEFKGEIVGANLLYDLEWLAVEQGIHFPNARLFDVQIAEPLIDENRRRFSLDSLSRTYLGEGKYTETLKNLYGPDHIKHMDIVDPGYAGDYCEQDCCQAWQIADQQETEIARQNLQGIFEIESGLPKVIMKMRRVGVRIDLDAAEEAYEAAKKVRGDAENKIKSISGVHADIWASDSVAKAFDRAGVEYPRTKSGKPSFVKEWLERNDSEIAKAIVEARGYDKIGSTFIKSYIMDSHINGRIHCMFHQLKGDKYGAVSGRFSSSNPNLQNIPIRHPVLGPKCRSMFIPEEGHLWGSADWSQIEYRLLVHYSHLMKGIDASAIVQKYREDPDTDFHQTNAEITGLSRSRSKGVGFGVVYGMGIPALAMSLNVTRKEAEAVLEEFHRNSPFMKDMSDAVKTRAVNNGFITTILGRRQRFPFWECDGKMFPDRDSAMDHYRKEPRAWAPKRAKTHKSLNALLQGGSGDIMKKSMVDADKAGLFEILPPHITVHDELNESVPETNEGREAFAELVNIMETAVPLEIPLMVDAGTGANWSEAK